MDRETLETTLQDQAKAPRVTLDDVKGAISSVHYFTAREGVEGTYVGGVEDECLQDAEALKLMTFCVIVDKYGFTFIGSSAVASPENFNREIGEKLAYDRAFNQMWMPMGYYLKRSMTNTQPQETTWQDRLKSEAVELSAKIEKIKTRIESDADTGIDKQLLIQQKSSMLEYLEILADRMVRAGIA